MPDLSLDNDLAIAALLVAVVTYLATSRRERAIRRAELIQTFTAEFYESEEIYRLFADLDYDRFVFTPDPTTWLGADPERAVVHMLDLFNSLGHHWRQGIISTADVQGTTVGYAMLRAFESPEMRRYLTFVHGHDQDHLGTGVPFEYFQALAAELRDASARTRASNRGRPAVLEAPVRRRAVRHRLRSLTAHWL